LRGFSAALPSTVAKPAKAAMLDVNSATLDELMTLKGVGEARARAIAAGRPYKGKDELVQKNIVPKAVYNHITDQIVARNRKTAPALRGDRPQRPPPARRQRS
jgi:DNA uptake protein ComE-like DNA-binding protein